MPPKRARAERRRRAPDAGQDADRIAMWRSLHLLLQFKQIVVELIEAALPERALLRHPTLCRFERPRHETIGAHAPRFSRAHQPALFEDLEMLREGGQR